MVRRTAMWAVILTGALGVFAGVWGLVLRYRTSPFVFATVVSRKLEVDVLPERSKTQGPQYTAQIRLIPEAEGVAERTLSWSIPDRYPEDVLDRFDRFTPGARVPLYWADGNTLAIEPDVRGQGWIGIAFLCGFCLFFLVPLAWIAGNQSWWLHPLRMFLYFGTPLAITGVAVTLETWRQLAYWPQTQGRTAESRPLELLTSRAPEVTMTAAASEYFEGIDYSVVTYQAGAFQYRLPYGHWESRSNAAAECQASHACPLVYDPNDPRQVATPQPLNAESLAPGLAITGFGGVFMLIGLLVRD